MPRPKNALSAPDEIPIADLAAHIAEVSGELALLAGRARWPMLTYFLNMARVEAESRIAASITENASVRVPPSPGRPSARR